MFRENAIIWWKSLCDYTINLDDWDKVKKEFLETYEPKYSAKTICANFADLKQMPNESTASWTTSPPPWPLLEAP